MEGKIILVVGQRGCGKTTFLKERAKLVNRNALFAHDVGGNFKDICSPICLNQKNEPIDIQDFRKLCTNIYNGVFIFEEASIFFRHSGDEDTTNFLVTSRYRKNTVYFAFHSFRKLPWYILDFCDYLVVFKTKDVPSVIEDRFENPELLEVFNRVNASPNPYAYEVYKF